MNNSICKKRKRFSDVNTNALNSINDSTITISPISTTTRIDTPIFAAVDQVKKNVLKGCDETFNTFRSISRYLNYIDLFLFGKIDLLSFFVFQEEYNERVNKYFSHEWSLGSITNNENVKYYGRLLFDDYKSNNIIIDVDNNLNIATTVDYAYNYAFEKEDRELSEQLSLLGYQPTTELIQQLVSNCFSHNIFACKMHFTKLLHTLPSTFDLDNIYFDDTTDFTDVSENISGSSSTIISSSNSSSSSSSTNNLHIVDKYNCFQFITNRCFYTSAIVLIATNRVDVNTKSKNHGITTLDILIQHLSNFGFQHKNIIENLIKLLISHDANPQKCRFNNLKKLISLGGDIGERSARLLLNITTSDCYKKDTGDCFLTAMKKCPTMIPHLVEKNCSIPSYTKMYLTVIIPELSSLIDCELMTSFIEHSDVMQSDLWQMELCLAIAKNTLFSTQGFTCWNLLFKKVIFQMSIENLLLICINVASINPVLTPALIKRCPFILNKLVSEITYSILNLEKMYKSRAKHMLKYLVEWASVIPFDLLPDNTLLYQFCIVAGKLKKEYTDSIIQYIFPMRIRTCQECQFLFYLYTNNYTKVLKCVLDGQCNNVTKEKRKLFYDFAIKWCPKVSYLFNISTNNISNTETFKNLKNEDDNNIDKNVNYQKDIQHYYQNNVLTYYFLCSTHNNYKY